MDRESLYQSRSRPVVIELRRFCGIVQVTWLSSECSTINPLPERNHALAVHDYRVQLRSESAYSVGALGPEELDALKFYQRLKQLNAQWHCPFYEGVVAKRSDSLYPIQLRSAALDYTGWLKHRWKG